MSITINNGTTAAIEPIAAKAGILVKGDRATAYVPLIDLHRAPVVGEAVTIDGEAWIVERSERSGRTALTIVFRRDDNG